jgi:putative ABC transport system ATP-binding protein
LTVAPPDDEVLRARTLVKSYDGSPALCGVSLGVTRGEILAVTGPHGCGKTTLLGCLSGRLRPDDGEVWYGDIPLHTLTRAARERLRRDSFAWIGPEPQLVPELTARENAALPLLLAGTGRKQAVAAAHEWLERLDVADCARRRPGALTMSQRQRVAVARALVAEPDVLFADEPTAPLHRADGAQVLRVLSTACRSHGITIVLATGEESVAACADRRVTLLDGTREDGEPGLAGATATVSGTATLRGTAAPAALPARPAATRTGATGKTPMARSEPPGETAASAAGLEGANRCSASA